MKFPFRVGEVFAACGCDDYVILDSDAPEPFQIYPGLDGDYHSLFQNRFLAPTQPGHLVHFECRGRGQCCE